MDRRAFLTTSAAVAAACARRGRVIPVPGPQRGLGFDAYQARRPAAADFRAIRALGATHVALFPFGFMRRHTEPEVLRFTDERTDWSLTDGGLLTMGGLARQAGLQVILVPTLADFWDGHWRGEVTMRDDQDWKAWFRSYRAFLLHYAALATRMGAAGLSVGTELRRTVRHETAWREIIAQTRARFRGWLTYAANWDDYVQVPWWNAVDLIGVQAYFELGDGAGATLGQRRAQLIAAWQPIKQELASLAAATDKRILFTEIGYKSHAGATANPWDWELSGAPDPVIQRAAYEAVFEVFWLEPWFAGLYWWKWRPGATADRDHARDFSPQGKPAEDVIRRYYLKEHAGFGHGP